MLDKKLLQSQAFYVRQEDDLHSVKLVLGPVKGQGIRQTFRKEYVKKLAEIIQ